MGGTAYLLIFNLFFATGGGQIPIATDCNPLTPGVIDATEAKKAAYADEFDTFLPFIGYCQTVSNGKAWRVTYFSIRTHVAGE